MRTSSLIQGVLCNLVCELATVPGQTYFLRLAVFWRRSRLIKNGSGMKESNQAFLKGFDLVLFRTCN